MFSFAVCYDCGHLEEDCVCDNPDPARADLVCQPVASTMPTPNSSPSTTS